MLRAFSVGVSSAEWEGVGPDGMDRKCYMNYYLTSHTECHRTQCIQQFRYGFLDENMFPSSRCILTSIGEPVSKLCAFCDKLVPKISQGSHKLSGEPPQDAKKIVSDLRIRPVATNAVRDESLLPCRSYAPRSFARSPSSSVSTSHNKHFR